MLAKPLGTATVVAALVITSPAAAIVIGSGSEQDYFDLAANYSSVGQVSGTTDGGVYLASGVVVAENWVLTAGHVTYGVTPTRFYLDDGGDFGDIGSSDRLAATFDVTFATTYPKYDGGLGDGYDIGLMWVPNLTADKLDALNVTAATLYTDANEGGQEAVMVGYGATGTGSTGDSTFDGLKRAGTNTIDAYALTPGRGNRISLVDFDDGTSGNNSYGSAAPTELESLIAGGDSGGGLFIDDCGAGPIAQCLAGITSFGWGRLDGDPNSDYGDVGGFTRVSYFNDWIMSVINAGDPTQSGGGNDTGGNGGGKGGGPKNKGGAFASLVVIDAPEPAPFAILSIGLTLLAWRRRSA
jgi:hypothetical protein